MLLRMRNLAGQANQTKRLFNSTVNNGITEIYLYDEIGPWGVTASDMSAVLTGVKTDRIDLHISTPGGDVFDGLAIYNSLLQHPANVRVVIDGLAASAGSFIAMAGDEIHIARNAMMMIHDAMAMTFGNYADHVKSAELLDGASNTIADIYAKRAGGTSDEWRSRMRDETWYFSGEEAVNAGLANTITGTTAVENNWDLSIFNYRKQPTAAVETVEPKRPEVEEPTEASSQEPQLISEENLRAFQLALKEAFKW